MRHRRPTEAGGRTGTGTAALGLLFAGAVRVGGGSAVGVEGLGGWKCAWVCARETEGQGGMWRLACTLAVLPFARSEDMEFEVDLGGEASWSPEPEPMVGYNCSVTLGHRDCQKVYAPDPAAFGSLGACEDSGCPSCRKDTCHAHGECTDHGGCVCDTNYYPSSSCSLYCEPTATCHGHGKCQRDVGVCECDADYYPKSNCTTYCKAEETCNGNGKCGEAGTCECNAYYYPPDTCEHSKLLMGAAVAGAVSLVVVRRLHLPLLPAPSVPRSFVARALTYRARCIGRRRCRLSLAMLVPSLRMSSFVCALTPCGDLARSLPRTQAVCALFVCRQKACGPFAGRIDGGCVALTALR